MKSNFLRLLDVRQTKDKRTIRVAIVSEIVDSFETVIEPDGLVSPLESVVVDYNHNRISTGAKLYDAGYTDITIPIGNGEEKKVQARVVDIEVYKDSKMWTRRNESKRAEDVPSLFEAVENGRVGWASVDFEPVKRDTEVVYDAQGNKKREVYKKWRLNFLSLLDTKPGQDTSYFLSVRSRDLSINNNISMKRNKDELLAKIGEVLQATGVEMGTVTDIAVHYPEDAEAFATFVLDGEALKQIDATVGDDGGLVLGTEIKDIDELVIKVPGAEEEPTEEEPTEEAPTEEAPIQEAADTEENKTPVEDEEESDKEKAVTKRYIESRLDDVLKTVKEQGKTIRSLKEEKINASDVREQLEKKEGELKKLQRQYKKLSASPDSDSSVKLDSATDMETPGSSESANKEAQEEAWARQASRANII